MAQLAEDIYDRAQPPPLLITIGPQCCGKTSLLRRLNESRPAHAPPLIDVAIDNDRDVYRRVPMLPFLEKTLDGDRDMRIRGRLVSDRCLDPGPEECRIVLGYVVGLWDVAEAEARLAALSSTQALLPQLLTAMERAKEVYRSTHQDRNADGRKEKENQERVWINARFYRLFVPEAIPRAVKNSNERLRDAVLHHLGPVAWGNTNAKTPDFKGALQAAEQAKRRAILVRWGHELDRVSLEELLVRNILRAMKLGRYIPALSVQLALQRTETLVENSGQGETGKLLAMAGFTMDARGCPRAGLPPLDERPPLIRPFVSPKAEVGWKRRGEEVVRAMVAPLCSAGWGMGNGGRRDVGWADVYGGGGGGAGVLSLDELLRGEEEEEERRRRREEAAVSATRAVLHRVGAAVGWLRGLVQVELEPPPVVWWMGEWKKMKQWSKASADMNEDWRRDYEKARNITLAQREEEMKQRNGTDPWLQARERFDFELWTVLRTLTGYNNNRF